MAKTKKRRLKHGTKATAKPRSAVRLNPAPWDMGADGPANKARASAVMDAGEPEIDPDTGKVTTRNPNGVKRMVYKDMLEVYHDRGVISDKGYEAGRKLREAWELTQRGQGSDWTQDKVDSSPKPDAQAAIQVDRMSAYVRVKKAIPQDDNALLMAVVCDGHSIGHLREYRALNIDAGKAHLRDALERLATRLGC